MQKSLFIFIALFTGLSSPAQNKKINTELEMFFFSRHIWRGERMGNAPAIEPSVTFSRGRFGLNLWAAHSTDNSYSEIDVIPFFCSGPFCITIFDYYNPVPGEKNDYFNFSGNQNRHSTELSLSYEATVKLPVNWMIGSFVLGDKNPQTRKPFFSTYAELSFPFSVFCIELEPLLGVTTHKGYYADSFAFVNSGIVCKKDFSLSEKWILLCQLSGIYNLYINKFYFNVGAGIRLKK
ncbi:MAG: hypothetical protein RBS73_03470 [Prolixibacteraceae bacterium]|jgi:hypothetical protein|nr:hypothetical protein [Prolixibacteraceae bacterium]